MFFCVSLRYEMLVKLHLILALIIRCIFPNILYLSETQNINFNIFN